MMGINKLKAVLVFASLALFSALSVPKTVDARVYFRSCSEAHAAGYSNMRVGDPGYGKHLDRDNDGVACELGDGNSSSSYTPTVSGWQQSGYDWYYYVSGFAVKGWQRIGGLWYYFNGNGVMQTSWQYIDGKWYYLASSGEMKTGWQNIGGVWYYLASSGEMKTGWQKIDGTWYYLEASGAMGANKWVGDYYLGTSGAMLTNTITPDGRKVDENGKLVKEVPTLPEKPTTTTSSAVAKSEAGN